MKKALSIDEELVEIHDQIIALPREKVWHPVKQLFFSGSPEAIIEMLSEFDTPNYRIFLERLDDDSEYVLKILEDETDEEYSARRDRLMVDFQSCVDSLQQARQTEIAFLKSRIAKSTS